MIFDDKFFSVEAFRLEPNPGQSPRIFTDSADVVASSRTRSVVEETAAEPGSTARRPSRRPAT